MRPDKPGGGEGERADVPSGTLPFAILKEAAMNIDVRPNLAAGLSTQEAGIQHLSGVGNGFETEALPGALPVGRNSPPKCPHGPYAAPPSGSPVPAPPTPHQR